MVVVILLIQSSDIQPRSVSQRVKRLFFGSYTLSVLLILFTTIFFLESLEEVSQKIDREAEIEHLLTHHQTNNIVHVESATLTLIFIPSNTDQVVKLPSVFQGLPIPYDDEVETSNEEYLVIIDQIPEGTYYLAKDMSLYDRRENLITKSLFILSALIIFFGGILAIFISGLISRPIKQLAQDILTISESQSTKPLPVNYKDSELNEISNAFNHYLSEIDQLIKRERSLITMASHELRTPIAVILGAAEVLDRRKQLSADDQLTLQRIINSAETMSMNVDALLTLVRQTKSPASDKTEHNQISLAPIVSKVIANLCLSNPSLTTRILFNPNVPPVTLTANSCFLEMLLTNLITNGLNHNQGKVTISISNDSLTVHDEAITPLSATNLLNHNTVESTGSTGLGLYIVTLICDQCGWSFTLETSPDSETCARVIFHEEA